MCQRACLCLGACPAPPSKAPISRALIGRSSIRTARLCRWLPRNRVQDRDSVQTSDSLDGVLAGRGRTLRDCSRRARSAEPARPCVALLPLSRGWRARVPPLDFHAIVSGRSGARLATARCHCRAQDALEGSCCKPRSGSHWWSMGKAQEIEEFMPPARRRWVSAYGRKRGCLEVEARAVQRSSARAEPLGRERCCQALP